MTVAVRTPGSGPGGRDTRVRKFGAFYGVLRDMTRWLISQGVTHVAMEATGVYTMPVYHALLEPGRFERVLVCNAAHVKNVPGRKTDAIVVLRPVPMMARLGARAVRLAALAPHHIQRSPPEVTDPGDQAEQLGAAPLQPRQVPAVKRLSHARRRSEFQM